MSEGIPEVESQFSNDQGVVHFDVDEGIDNQIMSP